MKSIARSDSLLEKLLFPRTSGLRVLYHMGFWTLFVLVHYAYAIPTLAKKASDPSVTVVGFLYFLKVIPEYYLCVWLYQVLRNYLQGFFLFLLLLVSAVLLNHLFSVLLFLGVDDIFGLENMTERFQIFARLYLTPFRPGNTNSWLVFTNDLSEIQFFMVPVALKIAKYAAQESIMRQKLQNDALRMELMVLKSQINPHFVFNVLNAAYAKILPISEEAAHYLQKASDILRFSLYEANDEFIQLEKELSFLKQYVELESIRSNRRSTINLVQQGEAREDHRIPTLLLITLVENAFKHGVHATRHHSYVDIQIQITNDVLDFRIVNSKPPQPVLKSRKADSIGGLGLANLAKRMQLYYPDNHVFDKKESSSDYQMTIRLPLI